jgi:hypothetical protein
MASLSTSVAILDALCREVKAIQVDDLHEMIDILTALRFVRPLPWDTGAALMGASGGPSVLANNEIENEGLRVLCLSPAVQAELNQSLSVAGSIFPLDAPNFIAPAAISTAMQVISRVPRSQMLIYHPWFYPISHWGLGRLSPENFGKLAMVVMKEAVRKPPKLILLALCPPRILDGITEFLAVEQAVVEVGLTVFYPMRQLAWRYGSGHHVERILSGFKGPSEELINDSIPDSCAKIVIEITEKNWNR